MPFMMSSGSPHLMAGKGMFTWSTQLMKSGQNVEIGRQGAWGQLCSRSSYPQCTVLVCCIPTHVRTSSINIYLIVEMHIVWTENMQYDTISKGGVDCAQNPWQRPWENCVEECLLEQSFHCGTVQNCRVYSAMWIEEQCGGGRCMRRKLAAKN